MKKAITTLLFGICTTVISLMYFVKSFEKADYGEYGKEFSTDENTLIMLITGIAIVAFSVSIINAIKNNKKYDFNLAVGLGLVGCINLFGPLKPAFKIIVKIMQKKEGYAFNQTFSYFIWALCGAFILAYAIIIFIEYNKKKDA